MKKLYATILAVVGAVELFAATSAEQSAAEVKPTPVPFKILNPFRVRRTRSHSIRLIHWGRDTYRYEGKIKFDGIVAEGDFRQPPLVVLKYDGLYYFICALPLSNYVDFQLYDGKTIRRVPCRDVPFEVLTYRFPDDSPKSEKWQYVLSVYVLRELLRTDQRLCEKVLRRYLSDDILKPILCLHFPWGFSEDLYSLAIWNKIEPELKPLFFRDIQNIIGRGLTELHSSEELQRYFFILCCLDYPRAAVFAEKFCSEYDRADKAGTLKLYGGGFAPDDPRFPKGEGEKTIRLIKEDIAEFDDKLKRTREYNKRHPVLYPIIP